MTKGFMIIFKSIFEIKFDFSIQIAEPKDLYIILTGFIIILVVDIITGDIPASQLFKYSITSSGNDNIG